MACFGSLEADAGSAYWNDGVQQNRTTEIIGFRSSVTHYYDGTLYTGLTRNAAGTIEINNGTSGGKGSLTFNSTGGIVGTTTNNNVDALSVGEFIQTLVAVGAPVNLTNNTAAHVCNVSLTASDSDVQHN